MFSIAAINDTDSKGQWEPLAPSKEAQEFHLSQTYNEGLHKLHSKEYEKACELFESILKDPLISSAQEDNSASDGHVLHLRFLALKNLASVFLQQGSTYYERALHCYLEAVEIDAKDSVVWNQLGTLSCSMGSLSISRWAFEQGLLCSPSNWIFMEKLLEVLIAIGDEVACLAVAEMILRQWPSHSRALCVKSTIEESEIVPFAPRGIDKLKPQHAGLKFSEKRKSPDENLDSHPPPKKLKPNIEIKLAEASWNALSDALLDILLPLSGCKSNGGEKGLRSGDVCLNIQLPSSTKDPLKTKGQNLLAFGDDESRLDLNGEKGGTSKEKAVGNLKEQPQERRSTRLERMRSHKPEKEESEFAASKDNAEVIKFLEPFIADLLKNEESSTSARCSAISCKEPSSCEIECSKVARFVRETSGNFGAYHLTHLLLEEAAKALLRCQDAFVKFLGLEKLCRNWGQDRTPGCSLFLAELYYDLGLSSEAPELTDFVTDSSYHLCKIVESVALEQSFSSSSGNGCIPFPQNCQGFGDFSSESTGRQSPTFRSLLLNNDERSFWVRFFWLSGRLAVLDDNKANAYQQFCMALSILSKEADSNHYLLVSLPHCKTIKELTIDRLLYEINMLKVDVSLEKEVQEMYEKQMYQDCINLLAPLLFCTKETYLDDVASRRKIKGIASRELFALETLIKACEKTKPMLIDVCLTCHQRKLQNLLAAAGMDEFPFSCKLFPQKPESTRLSISDVDSGDNSSSHWSCLVAEEVKTISHCALLAKNGIDTADSSDLNIQTSSIHDIQLLLLTVMCNIAHILSCKKSVAVECIDLIEQKHRSCFIDAAIAFCKFQFLNLSMPIKCQVELIVAIHDLLAEYGLCCAGEGKEGEEGTFLRFAIKHLLTLDMKLKSAFISLNGEATQVNGQHRKDSNSDSDSAMLHSKTSQTGVDEATSVAKDIAEGFNSNGDLLQNFSNEDNVESESKTGDAGHHDDQIEGCRKQASVFTDEVTEDEKEELELKIDSALDQCFFCLYGLNLRSDSSYEDELAMHKNTSRGEYQTKEQSADVFQYLLPYAKGSSKTGLVKLRRVLRAIRKHFPQPPESVLAGNPIDKFLDDPDLCEDELSEDSGSEGFFETMTKTIFSSFESLKQYKKSLVASSEQYVDVYCNLYFFLAQSEEMSATDKWPGFVLTKEGEEFVQQNANLFKYDLLYNPLRLESWQRLANIYDEEVDLLLNDGSKHINVLAWRKNATLSQRVETSRRRSRRCLLMSLALAQTPAQQCEIHELLALVYYDSLQNVAPLYDQRSILPAKDAAWIKFCENSMKHFKKAFANKPDWSHAFYMGKLSEKLGCAHEIYLSYFDKAIAVNPSAVDPVYRMHASRLKLLCKFGLHNKEALKVVSANSFSQSTKAAVIESLNKIDLEVSCSPVDNKEEVSQTKAGEKTQESYHLENVWNMLYDDCLAALETCVEGDLKHFHKARYMLAQGFYRRGRSGDLERAKEELSFCFKSSRSSFTINMWEIDGMVKKGRRRTPNVAANKKALEVILPESSRKFISCIRKYILFYLKLLEEAKDVSTLDKAFISIKADKRFSLCVEDLVPVALARYIRALIASSSPDYPLEKLFSLFMEQGNIWPDVCSLPEMKGPDTSESSLNRYLHQYIHILERSSKLETIEAINEKLRKRFKNPKLSNSNCAKVCRHASVAWCRSLIISLAAITPLELGQSTEIQDLNLPDERLESNPLLCIDLQSNELWNSQFEDPTQLKAIEMKWSPILSKIKNMVVRKIFDHHLDTANSLLRCSYNFYRDSSCVTLPNVVNLYLVSHKRLATETALQTATQGIEILDLSIPRKLLLWAYTLLHGHCPGISAVVKYCEENVKPKTKKGTVAAPASTSAPSTVAAQTGGGKDSAGHSASREGDTAPTSIVLALPESSSLSREWQERNRSSHMQVIGSESSRNLFSAPQLQHCNNSIAEKSTSATHDQGLGDGSFFKMS